MQDLRFARQPMFNQQLEVCGYELYFRSAGDRQVAGDSDDQATSQVIVNAFVDSSADRLLGAQPAFLNLGEGLLRSGAISVLPPDRVVLEVVGGTEIDDDLDKAVRGLKHRGFRIAVDASEQWHMDRLLDAADFVAVDIRDRTTSELAQTVQIVREMGKAQLIATRIESHEEFESCKKAGFDFFQGYFLCRPKTIVGRAAQAHKTTLMQLLVAVNNPAATVNQLEAVIQNDVGMTYRLLKLINSAFYRVPRQVTSIRQALTLLGLRQTRQWLSLMALAGIDDKPTEVFNIAMVRGKMCELLATATHEPNAERFFMGGLFSVLDAMMDRPIEDLVRELPLSDDVLAALLRREGAIGRSINCVVAQEQCKLEQVSYPGLDEFQVQECYLDAIAWATDVLMQLQ